MDSSSSASRMRVTVTRDGFTVIPGYSAHALL
jgi:hypothetical protein